MSKEAYSTLPDSVLAWKKSHKLGRFDPDASEVERKKIASHWHEAETKGIDIGRRCRLGSDSTRIGTVAFIGEVPEIPELGGPWVGVVLDEPMGKNNGTIGGRTYFSCPDNRGVFVRPERVYIGDFRELFEEDEDMEEI
jgi:tubulin-folding cofactor B